MTDKRSKELKQNSMFADASLESIAMRLNELFAEQVCSYVERDRDRGELLILVKNQLPHGEFGPWVQANCIFSYRSARQAMRIAARWPELESKMANPANLTVDEATKLLADSKGDASIPDVEPEDPPIATRGVTSPNRPPTYDDLPDDLQISKSASDRQQEFARLFFDVQVATAGLIRRYDELLQTCGQIAIHLGEKVAREICMKAYNESGNLFHEIVGLTKVTITRKTTIPEIVALHVFGANGEIYGMDANPPTPARIDTFRRKERIAWILEHTDDEGNLTVTD